MKRIAYFFTLSILICMSLGASCPTSTNTPSNTYQTAYTTITIMEITLNTLKTAFNGIASVLQQNCTQKLCKKLYPSGGTDYTTCLSQDHATNAEFKKCYTLGTATPWINKGVSIGLEGCTLARAALKLRTDLDAVRNNEKLKKACKDGDQKACTEYQQAVEVICLKVDPTKGDEYKKCVAGEPVGSADWYSVAKKSACLAYQSLKMVPANAKYDLYLNASKSWLKSFGSCVD